MRRLCLGLLLVLALVKHNYVSASSHLDVTTAREFITASCEMSDTIKKATAFTKRLKFLGGALGVLAVLGSDEDAARHRQVMN